MEKLHWNKMLNLEQARITSQVIQDDKLYGLRIEQYEINVKFLYFEIGVKFLY